MVVPAAIGTGEKAIVIIIPRDSTSNFIHN